MKTPNAGQAVSLQFKAYRERVRIFLRAGLLRPPHTIREAEGVLHMTADLVCDDIRLCEIAGGFEAAGELATRPRGR